jgi:hypothetical protein
VKINKSIADTICMVEHVDDSKPNVAFTGGNEA